MSKLTFLKEKTQMRIKGRRRVSETVLTETQRIKGILAKINNKSSVKGNCRQIRPWLTAVT